MRRLIAISTRGSELSTRSRRSRLPEGVTGPSRSSVVRWRQDGDRLPTDPVIRAHARLGRHPERRDRRCRADCADDRDLDGASDQLRAGVRERSSRHRHRKWRALRHPRLAAAHRRSVILTELCVARRLHRAVDARRSQPRDRKDRNSHRSAVQAFRSRRALPTTLTDDKLIASAAISGDSSSPNTGYSTPAAIGTPSAL